MKRSCVQHTNVNENLQSDALSLSKCFPHRVRIFCEERYFNQSRNGGTFR